MTARMGRCLAGLVVAAATFLVNAAARAETCTVSAGSVAFGIYDPLAGTPLDSTGTVQVTCTSERPPRVTYEIQLNTGQSGSFAPRAMTNGMSQLTYNLYIDAARSAVWGNGTSGTAVITADYNLTPPGSTQTDSYTVYGRVPASQSVTVGSYLDTITVTVVF